jgi:CRISPR system Cascade subunit CasE
MYLTRLTLDLCNAQARRDFGDAYEMHRTLVRAFVDGPESEPPRFLWRLEAGPDSGLQATVVVQSAIAANWSVLEALPNYLRNKTETKRVALEALIRTEEHFRFRLMANPTITREGKRRGLLKESEQGAWIRRQGMQHGFEVQVSFVTAQSISRSGVRGKSCVSIHRVCFEGVLKVRDENALRCALVAGIGPAKAFGCGLLSLAPCKYHYELPY